MSAILAVLAVQPVELQVPLNWKKSLKYANALSYNSFVIGSATEINLFFKIDYPYNRD